MFRMGAIGLALATSLAGVARADQWTVPSVPWMLGDWGGLRTRLYEKGIDFQFGYANEFGTNTQATRSSTRFNLFKKCGGAAKPPA